LARYTQQPVVDFLSSKLVAQFTSLNRRTKWFSDELRRKP